ncbi:hypothetical protein [Haloglomus irregulare]|jgi:hypothetical protein|uniref:hypothetical protein n=1 Tax=Haloglomus irregulare TaxID=2234134 RepID=UPI00163DC212|nr:hypothetical protein [Haloglomus irregulare]
MCGPDYGEKGYLQHFASCDGAGVDEGSTTATEPSPTEAARHETDRPNLGLVRSP